MARNVRFPSGFRKSKSASVFVATRAMRYSRSPGKAAALYGHVITDRPLRGFSRAAESGERADGEGGKEADDDGYKDGCPGSFSSATIANPSGDLERQLSTAETASGKARRNLTRYDFCQMILGWLCPQSPLF